MRPVAARSPLLPTWPTLHIRNLTPSVPPLAPVADPRGQGHCGCPGVTDAIPQAHGDAGQFWGRIQHCCFHNAAVMLEVIQVCMLALALALALVHPQTTPSCT